MSTRYSTCINSTVTVGHVSYSLCSLYSSYSSCSYSSCSYSSYSLFRIQCAIIVVSLCTCVLHVYCCGFVRKFAKCRLKQPNTQILQCSNCTVLTYRTTCIIHVCVVHLLNDKPCLIVQFLLAI